MSKIIIEKIHLPYASLYRTLRIYLPKGYAQSEDRYPVIYMHDGQNLYDPEDSAYGHIWAIKEFMDGIEEKFIVVGIDNHEGRFNRLNEYSPWINTELKNNHHLPEITENVGGKGGDYVKFIVEVLKPYIDKSYKTKTEREHTAIIGSSMGGLISLYAGLTYPEVFSRVGAFSTAVWFAEAQLLMTIKNYTSQLASNWYLDIGTHETSNENIKGFDRLYYQGTLKVHEAFRNLGIRKNNLMLVVEAGGRHTEKYWAKRLPHAHGFLQSKL